MEFISNLFGAAEKALELFSSSITFVGEMVFYIPEVIGSAIIVFLAAYAVRFCLLK